MTENERYIKKIDHLFEHSPGWTSSPYSAWVSVFIARGNVCVDSYLNQRIDTEIENCKVRFVDLPDEMEVFDV